MKSLLCLAILALVSCGANRSLIPAVAPVRVLPIDVSYAQQPGNAASATQDNSGTTGDQITKPAGAKGSTLIGCLSGPDKQGKYTLRSMNHRTGVEILGPGDMKRDSGSKVKLTGDWVAPEPAKVAPSQNSGNSSAEMRRFQVTDIQVMAKACSVPAETTPQSKNKKPKPTTYDAPNDDSSK